ncbi:hypothetical protein [Kribbia dieselivorans]|uniref:hypothetical protein n=1 Tax=Kribbia dieselivorans TaxID=331526 RepID=UPI00083800BB|nr:hypothetical protein [Kribbia dieselivorans]
MVTACTIRFSGAGYRPVVYANSAHLCTNVEAVSIKPNGDLYVDFHRGSAVLTVQVDEDETLTSRGISAGGSSGTNEVNVRFYDSRARRTLDLNRFADRKRVGGSGANIWLYVIHAAPPPTPSTTSAPTASTTTQTTTETVTRTITETGPTDTEPYPSTPPAGYTP